MPRPVLQRHVTGMGGRSGAQLRIQGQLSDAGGCTKRIHAVEHTELDVVGHGVRDSIDLWQLASIGSEPRTGRRTRSQGQNGQRCKNSERFDHGSNLCTTVSHSLTCRKCDDQITRRRNATMTSV